MPGQMLRRTPVAALAALLLVAGCGSTPGKPSSDGSTSPSAGADTAALSKPWLIRIDAYGGPDGESRTATYVSVVPETGKASAATMPEVAAPEVGETGRPLLVDAGQRWAIVDNRPSDTQRAAGKVVVHDLRDDAEPQVIDVRRGSGNDALTADWASFDPAEPGVLRVVSGRQVWKVDVPDGDVTRDGSLPRRQDWIYSGGFDRRTGAPYVESIDSFATDPAGNDTDRVHLLERDGGTQIDTVEGYGDLPDPGRACESSAAFTMKDGTSVAFCVVGRTVEVKTIGKGAKSWTDLSTTEAVAPGEGDPLFVLPPVS